MKLKEYVKEGNLSGFIIVKTDDELSPDMEVSDVNVFDDCEDGFTLTEIKRVTSFLKYLNKYDYDDIDEILAKHIKNIERYKKFIPITDYIKAEFKYVEINDILYIVNYWNR